jgi:hypothetical protein
MYVIIYNVLFSAIFAILAALIKEIYDFKRYGWKDQHKDIIADAGGIIFGVIVSLLLIIRADI